MSRLLSCVGPGMALAVTLSAAASSTAAPAPRDRVPGEIVVLLPARPAGDLDAALSLHGLARLRALTPDGRALVVRPATPDRLAALDARQAAGVARDLVARGVARAAAPNLVLPLHLTPNDPRLGMQWFLGTTAAGIRIRNAWDLETGDSTVVLGIIDTGVDRTHPDLASRIWVNPGEIPGNSIDDDGNGYVDDVNGWDFATNDNDPNPVLAPGQVGIDEGFHGTFIAGLAAAATNNATGIAGVSWGCRILPLKVSDASAEISLAAVTEAFAYAIDNGVSVLNLSFGGTDSSLAAYFQALVDDAVDADIVCVASAGNSGVDEPVWPAACDSVLAVAATNMSNQRASFSNWGYYVDIAAPGDNVYSTLAQNYTLDPSSSFFFSFVYGWDGVNPYMYNSGTSFACPLVAGAATLVRSRFPGSTAPQVIQQLVQSADVVAYDNDIGGRMNVYEALLVAVDATSPAGAAAPRLGPVAPNPLRLAAGDLASVSFTLPRAGDVALDVFDVRGRRVATLARGRHDAGAHRARWDGLDASGGRVPAGLYFVAGRLAGTRTSARVTVLP